MKTIEKKYQFTIFTPTYNRKDTLLRLYESILQQTYSNFEWLIIDDGSSDDTESEVKKWIEEGKIRIRYYYQENQHKFYSTIKASKLAEGEFFYTFDSDDVMLPDSLQKLNDAWLTIPEEERPKFSAVTGLCINQHDKPVGDKFPTDPFDSDTIESWMRYRIKGEKSGFQKTEIIRQLEFDDQYYGNGLIPEGVIWMSIASLGYKTRYINEVVRIYYQETGQGSLIDDVDHRKNSFGNLVSSRIVLNLSPKYFWYNPKYMILSMRAYLTGGFFQDVPIRKLIGDIKPMINKIAVFFFLPFGYMFYLKHK